MSNVKIGNVIDFTLYVICFLKYMRFETNANKLGGPVCESSVIGIIDLSTPSVTCCLNYHAVNNTCIACPPGFFGKNCSVLCPPGYFGHFCLEACQCQGNEICRRDTGCSMMFEKSTYCDGNNCTDEKEYRERFNHNNKTLLEESVIMDNVVTAALGSTVFLMFVFVILVQLRLRDKKTTCIGMFCSTLFRRKSTPTEIGGQDGDIANGHDVENVYSDIRASRMITQSDIERSYTALASTSGVQNCGPLGTHHVQSDSVVCYHSSTTLSKIYNTLSLRDKGAENYF